MGLFPPFHISQIFLPLCDFFSIISYVSNMKPIVQLVVIAVVLMLLSAAMAELSTKQENFKSLTDKCMDRCNKVAESWGTKMKTAEQIIECEDICDLFKVGAKVAVQAIQYGVTMM